LGKYISTPPQNFALKYRIQEEKFFIVGTSRPQAAVYRNLKKIRGYTASSGVSKPEAPQKRKGL